MKRCVPGRTRARYLRDDLSLSTGSSTMACRRGVQTFGSRLTFTGRKVRPDNLRMADCEPNRCTQPSDGEREAKRKNRSREPQRFRKACVISLIHDALFP